MRYLHEHANKALPPAPETKEQTPAEKRAALRALGRDLPDPRPEAIVPNSRIPLK